MWVSVLSRRASEQAKPSRALAPAMKNAEATSTGICLSLDDMTPPTAGPGSHNSVNELQATKDVSKPRRWQNHTYDERHGNSHVDPTDGNCPLFVCADIRHVRL